MGITADQLMAEIEATASALGIRKTTVGRKIGQGGMFYARLKNGKRFWPETAETAISKMQQLRASASGCDTSHANGREAVQAPVSKRRASA